MSHDVPSIWKYLSAPIMVLVGGSTSPLVFFAGSAHNMILHRASHSGDPMTREVFTSPFGL